MNIRRAAAATVIAGALLLPAQAALAQGAYPPQPPQGVSPGVQPADTSPPSDVSAGSALPRTGAGLAAAGGAGALLLGGGAALVAAARRKNASRS